jgi:hypothetical protein
MFSSTVEDTGYHVKPTAGAFVGGEVELTFRKSGLGYLVFVEGKQVRHIYAENDENVSTVVVAVMVRLAAQKQERERLRQEKENTDKCLLLLNGHSLPKNGMCRWNVHSGRAHLEIHASFRPERIPAFIDMVELADAFLEDGDKPVVADDAIDAADSNADGA